MCLNYNMLLVPCQANALTRVSVKFLQGREDGETARVSRDDEQKDTTSQARWQLGARGGEVERAREAAGQQWENESAGARAASKKPAPDSDAVPALASGGAQGLLLVNDLSPRLIPAATTDRAPQSEHGVDVAGLPMHACPFEASLHHQFVGTFHHPRANGPALSPKARIIQQGEAFAEVVEVGLHRLLGRNGLGQAVTPAQQDAGASMLEEMQASFDDGLGEPDACLQERLHQQSHMLSGMGKIQNAYRVLPMQVNEA